MSRRATLLGAEAAGAGERWAAAEGGGGWAALGVACATLAAAAPRLLARALPAPRLDPRRPYVFRLWVFAEWRHVAVDDRLPARGAPPRPLARSRLAHDYTLPLLAKAVAKAVGSYRRAARLAPPDALRLLTGGVVQPVRAAPRLAAAAASRATLVLALPSPHVLLPSPTHSFAGFRLRPAFAPSSSRPIDIWMSEEEFRESFSELILVHVPPDEWAAEPALRARRPWRAAVARRAWRGGVNAGGAPESSPHTADANPRFLVEVPEAGAPAHVVVALAQRGALALGLAVYAVGAGGERAPLRAMRALEAARGRAPELAAWFRLAGGVYAVVPHTRRPHVDAEFALRVLADDRVAVREANEDNALARPLAADLAELEALGVGRGARGEVRWSRGAAGALGAARDAALAGRVDAGEGARLAALAARWRAARGARREALALRGALAGAGATVSNKVLEALVSRFARGAGASLAVSREDFAHALAVLHLAHERYRLFDSKVKSNPFSLEEMILTTIYS